ncbi:MAG TPA: acetate/propionate family kinase [Fimbriiglobus sp.]|nr:acetate/propionate family kinase [Fimbriiglobus sp.]
MNVLALNPGSNSLRYKFVAVEPTGEQVLVDEYVDRVTGSATADVAARAVADCRSLGLDALGFRVVHGGERYADPARVTPELLSYVRDLAPLAPLHVPTDLAVIEAARRATPGLPAVAVFDTAFHRTIPEVARRYALPDEAGPVVNRFGFHGIAHQFVAGELFRLLGRGPAGTRVVSLHLGGGASACALRDGMSLDTSMGLTPLEGLVMSTRCGDLDPGVVLALVRGGMTADQVEELLARKGGLLGLSGTSGDIRDLEPAAAAGDRRAGLALEAAAYRVRKYVGAYAAALGGLDAVVLSGALAENSPTFRARVLAGLVWLGVRLDDARNRAAGSDEPAELSPAGSAVPVWLVPADEERQIARETVACLQTGSTREPGSTGTTPAPTTAAPRRSSARPATMPATT